MNVFPIEMFYEIPTPVDARDHARRDRHDVLISRAGLFSAMIAHFGSVKGASHLPLSPVAREPASCFVLFFF